MTYYQKRAREIMRDKYLIQLVSYILSVPIDDVQFYVNNESKETEKEITKYLSSFAAS